MAPRKKPMQSLKQNPKPLKSEIQILFERRMQKQIHKGVSGDAPSTTTSVVHDNEDASEYNIQNTKAGLDSRKSDPSPPVSTIQIPKPQLVSEGPGLLQKFGDVQPNLPSLDILDVSDYEIRDPRNILFTDKKPTNLIQAMDHSNTSENTPNNDLLMNPVNGDVDPLFLTPPRSATTKRRKSSPEILIDQSQNDGSDQISWKFTPENERLNAKRLNAKKAINPCSLKEGADRSLIPSSRLSSRTVNLDLENSMHEDLHDNNVNSNVISDQQIPFRTPPSLPNRSGKFMYAVVCNKVSNQPNLGLHKTKFHELLDEVSNDRTVDLVFDDLKACSPIDEENPSIKMTDNVNLGTKLPATRGTKIPSTDVVGKFHGLFTSHNFLVLEVSVNSDSTDTTSSHPRFKVLRLLNELSGDEYVVHLWNEWVDSIVSPGDTVDVIGEFDNEGIFSVDSEKNLLIVHPDMLLSGTRVASSLGCPRRSVLDERLKSSEHSTAALLGSLLHQLFQAALMRSFVTKEFLEEFAGVILQKNVESLYACGVNETDMIKALFEAIPKISSWITRFKGLQDPRTSVVDFGSDDIHEKFKISEVMDIEEMVWAPKYGLKGMIDASLRVTVKSQLGEAGETIVPFELKTGKSTNGQSAIEHRAQVILYTLLMTERYLKKIDSGLLYYLHTDQTQEISCGRSDLIGLIMRRNELASYILKASTTQQLPPMSKCQSMCRGCRHLTSCAVYHKAHGGNAENSCLGDEFESRVSHLTAFHFAFLRHWDHLIDLESKVTQDAMKKIWHSHSSERNSSKCPPLVVDPRYELVHELFVRDKNQFIYRFRRQDLNYSNVEENGTDPVDCSLQAGDYVILTTEFGHVPIANGIITEMNKFEISVSFSKHLRLPSSFCSPEAQGILQQIWHIDKDETLSSFAVMRSNLLQLFVDDERSYRLRKMIIDLELPKFDSGCLFTQDPAISYVRGEKGLNIDQRSAILKILTAKDYALILGMPGTGKTSTMVHAVKALLKRGASILLTSYTNSAVDNLLIKLKAQNVDFIRIGRKNVVHEEIMGQCISAMDINSVDEIKLRMDQVKVVAVTCLGITSPILFNRRFDVCIMDEAGQTTLPVSLGPLIFSSTFVLVGDHYQLPPFVQSTEALESGMGKSLFCWLSEAHPQAISALQNQYRMCQRIMELSNVLIYDNRLRCGSLEVANAKLSFVNPKFDSSWLEEVLDPDKQVVFINTDPLLALEKKEKGAVNNPIEGNIVAEVIKNLINHGIAEEDIGIITPYNSQINLIKQALDMKSVEIHTIDKYQGRDKDCIVLSFVRSSRNPRNSTTLLVDWHRINVALTRAKKKLIMVGSCGTLSKVPLLKLLIENLRSHSEILDVSKTDVGFYGPLKRCSKG